MNIKIHIGMQMKQMLQVLSTFSNYKNYFVHTTKY